MTEEFTMTEEKRKGILDALLAGRDKDPAHRVAELYSCLMKKTLSEEEKKRKVDEILELEAELRKWIKEHPAEGQYTSYEGPMKSPAEMAIGLIDDLRKNGLI